MDQGHESAQGSELIREFLDGASPRAGPRKGRDREDPVPGTALVHYADTLG